ncbi:hypothetical protein ACP70R_022108 [Stipagrostis hirtigluma subsp. patula]
MARRKRKCTTRTSPSYVPRVQSLEMQSMAMATFFPKPLQCKRSCNHAASASWWKAQRPSISWWRQRPHTVLLRCPQAQQHLAAEGSRDLVQVDDRLGQNPCNFQPSIWGDFFLSYSNPAASSEQLKCITERADKLKEEVEKMLASSVTSSLRKRLQLIDTLERLCLDHLFEEGINATLIEVNNANVNGCDLRTTALWFYLLRKHGYRVSPDVFVRFKDEEGCFLAKDPMDLLSLYNAANLGTHGETILDEAILFTRTRLETALLSLEGSLGQEIKSALEIPLPRRVRIYDSKYYIHTYEKNELKIITRWWKDLEIESRLPFARDRLVECYFWILGVYYEPCYSRARIILTMMIAIATIFDDMFDSYGTSEECELLTKCIERWDRKAAEDLPECMKFAFGKILDSYQIIDHELAQEEKYRMPYLKNFIIDLVRGYNSEVKMREDGYVPKSVEEHLQVSLRTGACHMLSCASFVGMGSIATKDAFDWVSSMPKMVKALCIILRLLDDLQTYERERLTPHVASTIESYMKEHSVSFEMACEKIKELKEETWKDFNGEWLNADNALPRQVLERIFNLTRTMEFIYNLDDNFSNCQNLKDIINSLFVEPFTITF